MYIHVFTFTDMNREIHLCKIIHNTFEYIMSINISCILLISLIQYLDDHTAMIEKEIRKYFQVKKVDV
jgi:hypothetical protein